MEFQLITIAPEDQELVFERFRRGRAGRGGSPGSGLGLSMAREIARAWDGAIRIAAREGGGTTVSLLLPPAARPEVPEPGALPALDAHARSVPGP